MKELVAGRREAATPVGLENIAQTCYMNSLFQYYFTVKPLRDAILNYEEHEEGELSDDELKRKQISKWELERSKRCTFTMSTALTHSHCTTTTSISRVDHQ